MIQDILIPFLLVGIAELGDKTQLAILVLSTKTKQYLSLLAGVMLAFVLTDGLAVLLGSFITEMVPMNHVRIGAGLVFILFGIIILVNREKEDEEDSYELNNPFISGFGLILVSEMGDKTQLASALFATQYEPVFVFVGVIMALFVLSATAVFLGKFIMGRINKRTISLVAGILFILMGISFLL
ncbi:MAG: TMEM165/GDT1 family protein [Methanosarcinaceae archaeon]|nr:TMEM165/GDT1 family protein [Methanosarcinaceae archaeon]